MNSEGAARQLEPRPCPLIEEFLPLLAQRDLSALRERTVVRHLEDCASCRARLAMYEALDNAAARYLPPDLSQFRPLSVADILAAEHESAVREAAGSASRAQQPPRRAKRGRKSDLLAVLPWSAHLQR